MHKHVHAHWLVGLLTVAIGVIIIALVVLQQSQGDEADTTVDIDNTAPVINEIIITTTSGGVINISEFNLTEGTTTTIYFRGTFTDANGCTDVTDNGAIDIASFKRSGGGFCTPNFGDVPTYCYVADSDIFTYGTNCSISNCSPGNTTADYECYLDIYFFADATDVTSSPDYSSEDWVITLQPYDDGGMFPTEGDAVSSSVEMNTLVALDLSDGTNIDYGVLSLGATSTAQSLLVRNTGNDNTMDLLISGTQMPCSTIGTIPTSSQRISSSTQNYEDMILSLSSSSQELGIAFAKQQSVSASSTTNTYWTLLVPTTGVLGTCNGTNTIQGY